jgi:hypothetical protein
MDPDPKSQMNREERILTVAHWLSWNLGAVPTGPGGLYSEVRCAHGPPSQSPCLLIHISTISRLNLSSEWHIWSEFLALSSI